MRTANSRFRSCSRCRLRFSSRMRRSRGCGGRIRPDVGIAHVFPYCPRWQDVPEAHRLISCAVVDRFVAEDGGGSVRSGDQGAPMTAIERSRKLNGVDLTILPALESLGAKQVRSCCYRGSYSLITIKGQGAQAEQLTQVAPGAKAVTTYTLTVH